MELSTYRFSVRSSLAGFSNPQGLSWRWHKLDQPPIRNLHLRQANLRGTKVTKEKVDKSVTGIDLTGSSAALRSCYCQSAPSKEGQVW